MHNIFPPICCTQTHSCLQTNNMCPLLTLHICAICHCLYFGAVFRCYYCFEKCVHLLTREDIVRPYFRKQRVFFINWYAFKQNTRVQQQSYKKYLYENMKALYSPSSRHCYSSRLYLWNTAHSAPSTHRFGSALAACRSPNRWHALLNPHTTNCPTHYDVMSSFSLYLYSV